MFKFLIPSIASKIIQIRDYYSLFITTSIKVSTQNLMPQNRLRLDKVFNDKKIQNNYDKNLKFISNLKLPEYTGGVNTGDQKAIFFIVSHFKFKKVLEIGTHIGCSLTNILLAMKDYSFENLKVDCIDEIDVNNEDKLNWLIYSSKYSPLQIVKKIKTSFKVNFYKKKSKIFLENCNEFYDFIFIDGSHKSYDAYYDITLSLKKLNKNGLILLHDYFKIPKEKNKISIIKKYKTGVFLACEKIKKENPNIKIIPIESLPWSTKINSSHTSLAIIAR